VEEAETTIKRLLCCGFQHNGKAMGQVYQCRWSISQKISVFPGSNITCFIYICDLFTDSPLYYIALLGLKVYEHIVKLGFILGDLETEI
jgi:hypothetical protein